MLLVLSVIFFFPLEKFRTVHKGGGRKKKSLTLECHASLDRERTEILHTPFHLGKEILRRGDLEERDANGLALSPRAFNASLNLVSLSQASSEGQSPVLVVCCIEPGAQTAQRAQLILPTAINSRVGGGHQCPVRCNRGALLLSRKSTHCIFIAVIFRQYVTAIFAAFKSKMLAAYKA